MLNNIFPICLTMLSPKMELLKKGISGKRSAVIALSGGVDSSVLALAAHSALGKQAVAVTVKTRSFPERELECAKQVAEEIGIEHRILYMNELHSPLISGNNSDRCYYCKKEIVGLLNSVREELGFNVIIEGSNISDSASFRPGKRAIEEAGEKVYSPFIEFGISKEDIRQLAKESGLSVADKSSSACLASRFPYGDKLTEEGISRVEKAEDYLIGLGFEQMRVRDHRGIARIEINRNDMNTLMEKKEVIVSYFKNLGFNYVTLDLEGLRSGSMDEVL